MATGARVIHGSDPPTYTTPSGARVYVAGGGSPAPAPQPMAAGYGGSLQSRLTQAFGGNPGVGSMQPGRVVSVTSNRGGATTRNSINYQDIINQMQQAQENANAANLERYRSMMDYMTNLKDSLFGSEGLYSQAQSMMQGIGQSARQRVLQDHVRNIARSEQDLISRGLGNTTVRESVRRGIGEDAERAMQQIDESVATQQAGFLQNQAGAQMQFGNMMADAILSREDTTNNLGLYLQLLQQLGAQGG